MADIIQDTTIPEQNIPASIGRPRWKKEFNITSKVGKKCSLLYRIEEGGSGTLMEYTPANAPSAGKKLIALMKFEVIEVNE